ncbi:GvpL/GvpF family gas vesicle protein [Streptomyces sp. NPDC088400]|uniref:GvpL/GvpF family gas vesicle protein n=1 Tax=Streptomyces sp. NPDC088400 TaxID=3365861 RepID=UPI00381D976C
MNDDTQPEAGHMPEPRTSAPPRAWMSYVYAIGRSDTLLRTTVSRLTGVGGGVLRTVSDGALAALVSSVPADAFGAEGMKAQMEDLERLEMIARSHHAVVEAACGTTTVLPMRLATVYLDDTRVAAMLQERGQDFGELLARLEGRVEMGVKVYADPAAAVTRRPVPAVADRQESPGRAYLRQRREQRRGHQDAYRAAGSVAAQVPGRVAALVRARVAHRPQQGELASGAGENIANEAYLVPVEHVEEFRQAPNCLTDDGVSGVRVEVTGPWAPYSFATPDLTPSPNPSPNPAPNSAVNPTPTGTGERDER